MVDDKAEELSKNAKILLGNYFAMDQSARESLLLISDGMTKNMPSKDFLVICLVPKFLRPCVLRFLLFRWHLDSR
jgi:hypothetical protein